MPKGPKGQKRPADVIGAAITVARIATGEITDNTKKKSSNHGGLKGGVARAKKLTPERRKEIAKKAATSRWN